LLESVYDARLCIELGKRGIGNETQAPIPLIYEGVRIDAGLRLNLHIEKGVILENRDVSNSARFMFSWCCSFPCVSV